MVMIGAWGDGQFGVTKLNVFNISCFKLFVIVTIKRAGIDCVA